MVAALQPEVARARVWHTLLPLHPPNCTPQCPSALVGSWYGLGMLFARVLLTSMRTPDTVMAAESAGKGLAAVGCASDTAKPR